MTPCDSLSNFLVENWHHNDSLNTYTYNKMIFEEMQVYEGYKGKYWNCMKNLTQKSLIALFGLPNQSRKDELWYYFNQKCYDGMKDGCMFISFHFGRDSLFEQSVITSVKKMQ